MIGIDITTTQNQYKFRGIGIFTKNVVQRFIDNYPSDIVLFGFDSETTLNIPSNVLFIKLQEKKRNLNIYTRYMYKRYLKKAIFGYNKKTNGSVTKFFYPFIHSGIVYDKSFETYIFVHDVIQKVTNKYSNNPLYNKVKKYQYNIDWKNLFKSKLVITNSNASKDDIEKYFGIRNVKVAYLGVDHEIYKPGLPKDIEKINQKYKFKGRYILYYSGKEVNKNIKALEDKFIEYKKRFNDNQTNLVILGTNKSFHEEKYIIPVSFVPDKEKVDLMANASIYMNLATYEGFGLSVLENMAVGNVCLISDIKAYRELFDGGAIFAEDNKIPDLIRDALDDNLLREKIRNEAINISQEYTWEDTFKKIYELINNG